MANDDVWHWRIALRGIDWNLRSCSRHVSHGDILCRRIRSSTLIIRQNRMFASLLSRDSLFQIMTSRRMSDTSTSSIDQLYFDSYKQFQVHELMLRDRPRVTAYHDAIMSNKHLFENKVRRFSRVVGSIIQWRCSFQVVLDVGSGTGILSMFAAKAGAKYVYAVDACSTVCHLAEELIKCNRLQDQIQVINQRIEEVEKFDKTIDIIISEWMGKKREMASCSSHRALSLGFYLFHESMLESVIYARDHFLHIASEQDDLTPDQNESIVIFPSHAYLVCWRLFFSHCWFECRFFSSIVLRSLINIFVLNGVVCGKTISI